MKVMFLLLNTLTGFRIKKNKKLQVLTILKLDEKLMSAIKQLGNPMHGKIVSISMLNKFLKNPEQYKNELMSRLFDDPCYVHTGILENRS